MGDWIGQWLKMAYGTPEVAALAMTGAIVLLGLSYALVKTHERLKRLESRLQRQEAFVKRAVTAMERSGIVPDSVEVESVEVS